MSRPVDHVARARAIEGVEASMTLSAGAGSGKTSVLTQRVLSLLAAGTPPGAIAAITFTEKAAGELSGRVRDGLEVALREADEPKRAVLRAALDKLSALTLSTIHSFCKGLLSAEALDAEWAPGTEVAQALREPPQLKEAWRRWRAGLDQRVSPLAALLIRLSLNDRALREATDRALSFRDLDPVMAEAPFDAAAAFDALRPVAKRLLEAHAMCLKPETDKLANRYPSLIERLRRVMNWSSSSRAPRGPDLIWLLDHEPFKGARVGRKTDWQPGAKEIFSGVLDDLGGWQAKQREGLHALLASDIQRHLYPTIAKAKLDSGQAGFDDLLFRAADLLERPEVRARLAARYQALLIDEVQDTDPIQARVAALLTRPVEEEDPSWRAAPPLPGRLFAVGDPKQSIYRFRRADVATWYDLSELVSRRGEALQLEQNFRSVPGIVEWVNHTFSDLPDYAPQVAWRPPADLDPVVVLPVPPKDKAREREALVAHLLDLKAHRAQVTDRETGQLRDMRWDDVMILLPGWGQAEAVQTTLARAGIPAVVEGGNSFFERDEIRLCIAALKALIEPEESEAVVFVLRGLFGLDYAQLAAHRAQEGRWRYTEPGPEGPVLDALHALWELRKRQSRDDLSWVEVLRRLLTQTRALGVWALLADGPARMANLDKLYTHLRRLEGEALTPHDLLGDLIQLSKGDEADLSRVDVDLEAARITSYFKSKGLEAPIVALCHATRRGGGVDAVVDRGAEEVALRFRKLAPPGWARREKEEKDAKAAERRRWMYVACTRPRDQLIIVDPRPEKRHADDLLKLITRGLPDDTDGLIKVAPGVTVRARDVDKLPPIEWQEETFPGLDDLLEGLLDAPLEVSLDEDVVEAPDLGGEAIAAARGASVRWRSVQDMAHKADFEGEGLGTAAGTLLHEVMERLDLSAPQRALEARALSLLEARAALTRLEPEVLGRLREILRGILRHEVIDRARAAPQRWQEVPFTIEWRGARVTGAIDLCFPTSPEGDRWVVVDWKSSIPAKGSAAWANYQRQLSYYEAGLKANLGGHIKVEKILVGPQPPKQAELF